MISVRHHLYNFVSASVGPGTFFILELSRKVEKAEGGKGQAASKKAQKGTISGKAEQKGIKRGRKR
jgi:hypothetical protein